ncbi:MAG: hypothetical protein AB8H79_25680 [Myxococcota bacterium]
MGRLPRVDDSYMLCMPGPARHNPPACSRALYRFGADTGLATAVILGGYAVLAGADPGHALLWGAVVWFMYLADRLSGGDEDVVVRWPTSRPGAAWLVLGTLAGVVAAGVWVYPDVLWGVVGLVLVGLTYFVPVPILGRAKEIPGGKAVFVTTSLSLGLPLVAGTPWGLETVVVWLLLFANASIYDVRDLQHDRAAGVRTLAVLLSRRSHTAVLSIVLLASALGAAMVGGAVLAAMIPIVVMHLAATLWLEKRDFTAMMGPGLDGGTALIIVAQLSALG